MLREGSIVDASSDHLRAQLDQKQQGRAGSGDAPDPQGEPVAFRNEDAMHTGVDDGFGMIHSLEVTAANEHDLNAAGALLHGDETRVFGDSGYRGIERRKEHRHRNVNWFIPRRPGVTRQLPEGSDLVRAEKIKASVRAKVEHPFRTIKRQFGYAKVRYRGLAKNANRLYLLAAFSNVLVGERYLPA